MRFGWKGPAPTRRIPEDFLRCFDGKPDVGAVAASAFHGIEVETEAYSLTAPTQMLVACSRSLWHFFLLAFEGFGL